MSVDEPLEIVATDEDEATNPDGFDLPALDELVITASNMPSCLAASLTDSTKGPAFECRRPAHGCPP
jgi:hypothetical protein